MTERLTEALSPVPVAGQVGRSPGLGIQSESYVRSLDLGFRFLTAKDFNARGWFAFLSPTGHRIGSAVLFRVIGSCPGDVGGPICRSWCLSPIVGLPRGVPVRLP